jgi:hypothetical protein
MERSNFALRLLPSLYKSAQRVADRENCSLNQLISLALAEKIAILDAEYWEGRKREARKKGRSDVLARLAGNEPPREGDDVPQTIKATKSGKPSRVAGLRAGGH